MFKSIKKSIVAIPAAATALFVAGSAHAALDTSITTSLETVKTDGMALGGLVLGVIIAIAGFKLIRRAF